MPADAAAPSRTRDREWFGAGFPRRRGVPMSSWGGVPFEERTHVGAWMVPSYDPALDLVYLGTSVTSPAPKFMLGGVDNQHLYHNATLDRATGEFLWATPTVLQNVISGIDGVTGAVTENAEVTFTAVGQQVFACPTWNGGKDWEAGAYSPLTNTMYMPLRNTCARMMATRLFPEDAPPAERNERRSELYAIAYRHQLAPDTENAGTVRAISAETGATVWLHEQRAATMSLVATGGGLVFGGDVNGRFRAFDHETGEVLWEINLGSAVTGFPITYAVDGRQFVAVSTGSGGTSSHFTGLTPELRPSAGNNLFVFALP